MNSRQWMAPGAVLAFAVASMAAPQARYSVSQEPAGGAGSPSVVVLHDDGAGVEAAVAPSQGGELTSLRVKVGAAWVELIYRAREYPVASGFRGKASFLWPAVGGQFPVGSAPASACADGTFQVDGHTYPMPCHGFAKDQEWEETGHTADSAGARVTVELRDSEKTRAGYPFGFRVRATYELAGGRLSIVYRVSAAAGNRGPMPFSIGSHIAFKAPFLAGSDAAAMQFETNNGFELLRDSHGLVTAERRARTFVPARKLGEFDAAVALPLAGYRDAPYAVLSDPQGLSVRVSHRASAALAEPLVQFNVYGGASQGYFCPEPWFGLQNSLNLHQGLVNLAPGADWQWAIEIQPIRH